MHFLGNSYYRNSEEDQKMMFVLSPYGLLFSSPDYDAILQTDIYYEGQEPDGFYNSETFINSIKNIYYTYVVSDVQWKGRNQYDVCIKGALSYRGSHWDEEGENVFVR
ncbi:MAG: hypothetical protein LBD11_08215 [Candidatus Peribacteria bacterium]|nr:hypothetical protein [Candidatus Peribacteria bacterium]